MFYSGNFKLWLALSFVALSFCSCIESEYPLISVQDRTKIGDVVYGTDNSRPIKVLFSHIGNSLYNFADNSRGKVICNKNCNICCQALRQFWRK
jgi:hypothetical protein